MFAGVLVVVQRLGKAARVGHPQQDKIGATRSHRHRPSAMFRLFHGTWLPHTSAHDLPSPGVIAGHGIRTGVGTLDADRQVVHVPIRQCGA